MINEVMANPSAVTDGNGEWFELYNTTDIDIDLDGSTITDDGADLHVIAGPVIVPAGGYAVLDRVADPLSNGGVMVGRRQHLGQPHSGQLVHGDEALR